MKFALTFSGKTSTRKIRIPTVSKSSRLVKKIELISPFNCQNDNDSKGFKGWAKDNRVENIKMKTIMKNAQRGIILSRSDEIK